jgi:hypothetical protein
MAPDDNWLTAVFERERWQLPAKPGEVERILRQVARRRRRRLLFRTVVACLAAVAIGATSALLVLRHGTSADEEGSSLLGPPQATGPIPQPRVVPVGNVADLTTALRGTTVKELNYRMAGPGGQAGHAIVPQGLTDSGNLIAMVNPSRGSPEVVELSPATGEGRTVAKAKLPELRSASVFRSTIVWTETAKATGNPDTDEVAAVYRCTDRGSGRVRDLAIPRHDPAGLDYDQRYAGVSVGSGGIAVEMGRRISGAGPNFSDDFDLYLATGCGARLRLIAARAASAQFLGDWLYYLHDGAIWRQNLRAHSASDRVIDKAEGFQLTDDVLVWTDAVGSEISTLHAARPDGSFARTIPVPETWRFAYASNAVAVAGTIEKAQGLRTVLTGMWIYLPSRGVIVVLDRPGIPVPNAGEKPAAAIGIGGGAAGNHVLLSEYGSTAGSTVTVTDPIHEWLVRLP